VEQPRDLAARATRSRAARADPADPRRERGQLRLAADPRRAASARRPRQSQAGRAADASGGAERAAGAPARHDHGPRARCAPRARSRRARLQPDRAEPTVGGRPDRDRDLGGHPLPSGDHRLLFAPVRRVGDGRAHARRARRRGARDGRLPAQARPWSDPPLRPGLAGRIQAVVATLDREALRWARGEGGGRIGLVGRRCRHRDVRRPGGWSTASGSGR
jgi:hypothetical protein